ncbi:MAG: SAM-dependent methyltransferase [Chlamydiales bacterium]
MKKEKPTLYLLPNLLGEHRYHQPFLPQSIDKAVATLDGLIAESVGGGRRFLGRFETKLPTAQIPIALYTKHTPESELDFLLEPILNGESWGFVSDAGLPCIADPGSKLVRRARQLGIQIKAFVGPSSILLALMLSGFPGQRFAFHGYLPKNEQELEKALFNLQKEIKKTEMTQIFIEAPHRNSATLEKILHILDDSTLLSVAWDLTLPTQGVLAQPIAIWKKSPLPNIHKKPATFLLA